MNTLTSPHLTVERGKRHLHLDKRKRVKAKEAKKSLFKLRFQSCRKQRERRQKRDGNVNVKKIVYGMKRVQ
jgi:hypothetical protein